MAGPGRNRLKRRHPLVSDMVSEMILSGHTFTTLGPIVNLRGKALSRWGLDTLPRIDHFDKAVQAVGGRLVIRRREGSET